MYTVYILYSEEASRYYIGYTSLSVYDRLNKHLSNHSGYTGKFKDWNLVYTESFNLKSEALRREKVLKNWKSKRRIQQLISEHPAR
ncbi:MAG TPA: GIY-YIG nuclease family protein [Bacteroidia bacterium]|nr:GIY-YIG nuclease family protein [Bacteroidia bacterium]